MHEMLWQGFGGDQLRPYSVWGYLRSENGRKDATLLVFIIFRGSCVVANHKWARIWERTRSKISLGQVMQLEAVFDDASRC
jgi:hypothetical protein